MNLILPGPYFTKEDLAPYIKKHKKDTLFSCVPGFIGPVRLVVSGKLKGAVAEANRRLCVYVNNKRMINAHFSSGPELVIVEKEGKYFLLSRQTYEKRVFPKNVPIYGS